MSTDDPSLSADSLQRLRAGLDQLADVALAHAGRHGDDVERAACEHRASALNLLHYLGVRQHDVRPLQAELARAGLSSLGRCEAHVLAALQAVREIVDRLAGHARETAEPVRPPVLHAEGAERLRRNADALFGPAPARRGTRIMVTMPGTAAVDQQLVRDLVAAGMDVMRINAAHDDSRAWGAMADHLERARAEVGRPCRLQLDLAGPKLRTGPLAEGERIAHWRPRRDARGRARQPAHVLLVPSAADVPALAQGARHDAVLPVDASLLAAARAGDRLRVQDVRGRDPELLLTRRLDEGTFEAEGWAGAYVETGAEVKLVSRGRHHVRGSVGLLPALVAPLELRPGDRLALTRSQEPGGPAEGERPARIPCTLAEVFADVRPGHAVWLDDGKLGGVVRAVDAEQALVEITCTQPGGGRLRPDKGINLPDTPLRLPALTEADLRALDFAVARADLVGLSFVRTRRDVARLMAELDARGGRHLGMVLKIETRQALENLADLLLTGMRWPRLGVMVARGDLAVELGFHRLAEVQEEILWLCEAAHVPVIWATQVLEGMARSGRPSRAEVTDAAMSERAECVMLNKGPHVVDAVTFLADVLTRMADHQCKKRSMLRSLSISHVHKLSE